MPMFLLVRQILGVNTDDLAALVAVVGEYVLVALDAVGMVVSQDIPDNSDDSDDDNGNGIGTNLWPARLSSQWWQNMIASSSTLVFLLRSPTVLKRGKFDKNIFKT